MKGFLRRILRADDETARLRRDFSRFVARAGRAGSLLDVGAGDCSMTVEYQRTLGVPAERMHTIEMLDKYISAYPPYIQNSKVNLEDGRFPYADEAFDLVVCSQVLEHLKNIFLPLSEMERVLKPGGYLALGVPNLAALHNRLLLAFGAQPLCNAITGPHIRCFAHKDFLKFLLSNPCFSLVRCAGSTLYPLPYPLVDYGARLFPGLSAYTFYLLRKERSSAESGWLRSSVGDTCL